MNPERMFSWGVPTIASIQRTNAILVIVTAAILAWVASMNVAIGCVLGGAVVIANLFLLAAIGRVMLAAAGGGRTAAKLGMLALPLKLLIVVGLVYLAFTSAHLSGFGFGLGILTQLTAIIIETGRASLRPTLQ